MVNNPIISREAVQEYVTHPEKKLNKHKKKGNFATHSTNEVFMICHLCDGKHDLDELSHLKKKAYKKEAGFYLSRNCAMAASLQYLLVTTQETVRKGKNAKFARKGTQLTYMVIRLKNPKKNLKIVVRKKVMSKIAFTVQQ